MTREEALDKATENGWIVTETENLINEIYDDFESRICKNCEWFNPKTYECRNTENYQTLGNYDNIVDFLMQVDEDFGCVNFKRREQ